MIKRFFFMKFFVFYYVCIFKKRFIFNDMNLISKRLLIYMLIVIYNKVFKEIYKIRLCIGELQLVIFNRSLIPRKDSSFYMN